MNLGPTLRVPDFFKQLAVHLTKLFRFVSWGSPPLKRCKTPLMVMIARHIAWRPLAGAFLIFAALAGCGQSTPKPPDFSKILDEGNASLRQMKEAAVRREYVRYFENYEALRKCYIHVARMLENNDFNPDAAPILDTLSEWEQMIEVARNAWRHIGSGSRDLPSNLPQKLQDLQKQGEENWRKKNDQWAPVESQLDEAIERIQGLQGKK